MYIVSPFTPLFFSPSSDVSGCKSHYTQVFAPTDQILIEVIVRAESRAITGKIISVCDNSEMDIEWNVWSMNDSDKLYYYVITGLEDGYYMVNVNDSNSEPFRITSDESVLKNTTLIQYSSKDNKDRQDVIFWVSEQQMFFDWRVHGGFKDSNWSFGVDNEQFTNSENDLSEIYSRHYTMKTFTLGGNIGCPIWYGEHLNRILSCTYVYFNGKRYIRSESNVPEINQVIDDVRSYVFNQILREIQFVDYTESENMLKIRRVQDNNMRQYDNRLLIL
mgnify:FL=1|jgi:hypothetical protein|nr:MAG TPA: hypothetical protein [Caudoviricetes sp.]